MADYDLQAQGTEALRFHDFELNLAPLALSSRGRPVELALQPLRLLALLAIRRGDLVTHQDIRSYLWGGRTVSFDNSTHVYVSQIRAALSDNPGAPSFIETVPRQGYRFVADVEMGCRRRFTANPRRLLVRWRNARAWVSITALALVVATALFARGVLIDSPGTASEVTKSAMDAYKRGLFLLDQRDPAATAKSLVYFDAALAADPSLAPAHSAAARAHGRLGEFDEADRRARRALTIDHNLVDAHVILGLIDLTHDWTWEAAFGHFSAALQRDNDNAQAHQGIASYYVLQGDLDAGIAHMRRARGIDPASTIVRADFGWFYYFAGEYGKAAEVCGDALDLAPKNLEIRHCLIRSQWLAGARRAAANQMLAFMEQNNAGAVEIDAVTNRDTSNALLEFDRWRLRHYESAGTGASAATLAFAAAGCGDFEAALTYAELAVQERSPMIPFIAVDPVFKQFESHSRFRELLRKIGLQET